MVIYFEDLQLSAIRDTERAFKAAKVKTSDRWMSRPLKAGLDRVSFLFQGSVLFFFSPGSMLVFGRNVALS